MRSSEDRAKMYWKCAKIVQVTYYGLLAEVLAAPGVAPAAGAEVGALGGVGNGNIVGAPAAPLLVVVELPLFVLFPVVVLPVVLLPVLFPPFVPPPVVELPGLVL